MSSPSSSPTPRHFKSRDRRVSFGVGTSTGSKAPGLPSHSVYPSPSSFTPPEASAKPRRTYQQRQGPASHNHSHSASFPDRRARVEDADAEEDPSGSASMPKTTASAAAAGVTGIRGVACGIDPSAGVNPLFTHLSCPSYGQQPFSTQAYPGFVSTANPPSFPFNFPGASTMATVDGPPRTGVNFLPVVPDASNGPMLHTYVPRSGMPMAAVPGPDGVGFVYVQQPPGYASQGVSLATMPITATTAPMMPFMAQHSPGVPQPMLVQQPSVSYTMGGGVGGGGVGPPVMMMPGSSMPMGAPGCGVVSGNCASMVHPEPALGVGQTPGEVLQEQLEFAYAHNMYEPQDFKPADDDVSRFYWVRELDGNWTQRSRATIDHIGCRWYITDNGVFYAIRLPD